MARSFSDEKLSEKQCVNPWLSSSGLLLVPHSNDFITLTPVLPANDPNLDEEVWYLDTPSFIGLGNCLSEVLQNLLQRYSPEIQKKHLIRILQCQKWSV